ncbi:MAG: FKBP-type peptidyl-prolyl cis-trans isomerase [Chthoniobacterales bacterium]
MKKSIISFALLALTSTGFAQGTTDLKTEKDKVSYSIGLDIGSTFKKQAMDINLDVLMAGLKDAVDGKKAAMTDDEVKATMAAYSKSMMEKQAAKAKEESGKNKAVGEKFLAENKTKEGVKVVPVKVPAEPGDAAGEKEKTVDLQYKVLKEGSGASPKETDTVVVQYKGTLIDGKEFDSSYKRNEPATFPVNRVIKGWTEGLQLMKPGAKYQFFIPSELAYGERGAGQDIGPNETLIFEVELVSIKAPEAAAPAPGMPPAGKPAPGASPAAASTPSASAKPAASPKPTAR